MEKNPSAYIEFFEKADAFGAFLGCRFISISKTECIYRYEPQKAHYNPNGILHGGVLYSVMDSSQGAFVHYDLDPSFQYAVTGTATVRYFSPVREGTGITIRTWLKGQERRKLFVSSSASTDEGNEVATLEEIWIGILKR